MTDLSKELPPDTVMTGTRAITNFSDNHFTIRFGRGTDVRQPKIENVEFSLTEFAKLLAIHEEREDKMGPYLCAPMKDGYRKGQNAEPWRLFCLDFDGKDGPIPDPEQIKAFFQNVMHLGHSTFSYTPENGKHRIALVLDREITPAEYREIFDYLSEILPFPPDSALNHCDQPVFLPACPPGAVRLAWSNLDAPPVPVDEWLAAYQVPRNAEDRAKTAHKPAGDSVIRAFNEAHDLRAILEEYGYQRRGKRYLWPGSESGMPGVSILAEGRLCFSHHASDPLADGKIHDAFDAWATLEHGGDKGRAAKEAATEFGQTAGSADPPPFAALMVTDSEFAELHPACIVQNYLYADLALLCAPGGTGKTTTLLYEAVHIALGRSIWGLPV